MIYTNNLNLPDAFVNAVKLHEHDIDSDISITQITNPPRQFWLKKRHYDEITVDVSDRIFSLYGSSVHYILQKYAPKDVFTEERLKIDMNGWVLSGQPDLFTEHVIQDWKLTSVYVLVFDTNKDEYVWQLNGYNYLAQMNGFTGIKKLQNIFLLRDWSRSKALADPCYPQHSVELIDQPIYPISEVEQWLSDRVWQFQGHKDTPDDQLPECTPDERWHKPDSWALRKKDRKTAIKVCQIEAQAQDLLATKYKGADSIEYRPGEDIRCGRYCDCREYCGYYKSMKKSEMEETDE